MTSEIYTYIYDKILQQGALDVYTESIYMKKNRPAIKLSVICMEEDLEKIIDLILLETTTFGVRFTKFNRKTLKRKFVKIDTPYGIVTVKIGYHNDTIIKVIPEYEDCKLIAKTRELPLYKVFNEINYIIKEKNDLNLLT